MVNENNKTLDIHDHHNDENDDTMIRTKLDKISDDIEEIKRMLRQLIK